MRRVNNKNKRSDIPKKKIKIFRSRIAKVVCVCASENGKHKHTNKI